MSVLNRTEVCDCGRQKWHTRQWCEDCYSFLSPMEREEFTHKLSELRHLIAVLEKNIAERRQMATHVKTKTEEHVSE